MEQLNKYERIVLLKVRRAKKYAEDNKQAEINICILPGGTIFIIKDIFQERIETEQMLHSKE